MRNHIVPALQTGYSRLMSADEAGTLAVLQAHRSEVIAPRSPESR